MTSRDLSCCLPQLGLILMLCLYGTNTQAQPQDPLATAFGKMPALWNVRLSPDASKISFLTSHSSGPPIALVWDMKGGKPRVVLASEQDRFDLIWCRWANEERLLCGYYAIAKMAGSPYPVTRLVAVNHDGSHRKVLMQRRLRGTFAQFQDDIVDRLPDDPKHILIEVPDRSGTGVKRLNIYTGSTRGEARIRSSVREWQSDGHGELRLRMSLSEKEIEWHYRVAGKKKWQLLHETKVTDLQDHYSPAGFGSDPNQLLVYKPFEGRLALWSEDLANDRATKVVFAHPEVDLSGGLRFGKFNRMVAVGYSTDRDHLHFFDQEVAQMSNRLAAVFPSQDIQIVDESWDKRYYLVKSDGDQIAGAYYRFDKQESVLMKISDQYPQLDGLRLSPMKTLRYSARDDEQIPAYLTLPISATEEPLPAVILPHGGPQSRDYWGYDWLAQFMAARGYAVLQSNYRGSGGFGSEWAGEGGFRSWRVAIDDITDGARHLVQQGVIDTDRICIVGWSYGGYAALMSAVVEPELYRCVVSIAGVTDLPMLIDDARNFIGGRAAREFVGKDREMLKQASPTKRADEIAAPVLLFHGDEDINVRTAHSQKMAKALERKKKQVEFIEYEDVEHSIRRSEYRIDMLTRIGAFLDRNTAPRITALPAASGLASAAK